MSLHNITLQTKTSVIEEFAKVDSTIRIIFATEALGMGVDIPDVRRVIHIGPPTSIESKILNMMCKRYY
jgi:superfamily II DNA helicase RecQ